MTKSPKEALDSMIANMPEKTGKSLTDWLLIVQSSRLEKHGQFIEHLKSDHGMTLGFANLVANRYFNPVSNSEGDLVETQYVGAKSGLLQKQEWI
jgi:hypothetical protein